MHEGTPHARERGRRRDEPHIPEGTIRPEGKDPFDAITDLFLGPERAAMLDDLPLPPLKSEVRPDTKPDPKPEHKQEQRRPAEKPLERQPASIDRVESVLLAAARRAREVGAAPARVDVESLVVGHLPAPASAWVHQYARWRHRSTGEPIALLRVRGNSCSIDLHSELPPAAGDMPRSLPDAVTLASAIARRWILSVDDVSEGELATTEGVSRIVILTATHHTAVVGAYQAIRGLSQLLQQTTTEQPGMCIAVVGGPEPKALSVASRLAQTANVFLGQQVETLAVPERIAPGRSTTLYVGPCDDPMHAVGMVVRSLPQNASKPPHPHAPQHASTTDSSRHGTLPVQGRPALLSGMTTLAVRCPHAPTVEIAASDSGDVHVLAAAESATTVDRAIADLVSAGSWVRTHITLIAACMPELARRVGATATPPAVKEHLITPDAKAARKLLDSPVKVHLRVSPETGQTIELN